MSDPTFRPERRPVTPTDIDPDENLNRMQEGAAIREKAGMDAVSDEGVNFQGNIPPQLLQALQSRKGNVPTHKGPKTRQKTNNSQPVIESDGKLQSLLKVLEAKKLNFDRITLPSKGKFYDGTNGPKDGVLHVRPMTGEEEEILATPRWVKRGEAINRIFNKCVQENFPSQKLLAIDRTFLLIFLRGISYTPEYEVEIKCPSCDRRFSNVINLDELVVDECPADFGTDSLTDILPNSGFSFSYRLETGEDDHIIQEYKERRAKFDTSNESDDSMNYRTALLLEDIEGLKGKLEIQKIIKNLPGDDLSYLRSKVNDPPFGVDTKISIPCTVCMHEFEIDLPMETSFFFPRAKRKVNRA